MAFRIGRDKGYSVDEVGWENACSLYHKHGKTYTRLHPLEIVRFSDHTNHDDLGRLKFKKPEGQENAFSGRGGYGRGQRLGSEGRDYGPGEAWRVGKGKSLYGK